MFWLAPVYFVKTNLPTPALGTLTQYLVWGERAVLIGTNGIFLVTSILGLLFRNLRMRWQLTTVWGLFGIVVWVCSIFQTLLDHGDNPRFLVPLQSVVVLWVIWVLYQEVGRYRMNRNSRVKSKEQGA